MQKNFYNEYEATNIQHENQGNRTENDSTCDENYFKIF